ncbi:hypothetical protein LWV33_21610 [Brucella intermedia]
MELVEGIITAVAGLIGAVIGAGASVWSQSKDRNARWERDVNGLRMALSAEISSYLSLIEKRGQIEYLEGIAKANEEAAMLANFPKNKILPKSWISGFEKANDPFPVFRSSLDKLGTLGVFCNDVGKFYSQASAIRITLIAVDEGTYDTATPSDLAKIIRSELALWAETEAFGWRLARQLKEAATFK